MIDRELRLDISLVFEGLNRDGSLAEGGLSAIGRELRPDIPPGFAAFENLNKAGVLVTEVG